MIIRALTPAERAAIAARYGAESVPEHATICPPQRFTDAEQTVQPVKAVVARRRAQAIIREAAIREAVLRGDDFGAIAADLGVARSTVRCYVMRMGGLAMIRAMAKPPALR